MKFLCVHKEQKKLVIIIFFLWQRAFLVRIPVELKRKRASKTEWESLTELIYFKTPLFATFMGWWWKYLKNQQGKLLRDEVITEMMVLPFSSITYNPQYSLMHSRSIFFASLSIFPIYLLVFVFVKHHVH